jgi:hypothetical protein
MISEIDGMVHSLLRQFWPVIAAQIARSVRHAEAMNGSGAMRGEGCPA